MYTYNDLLEIGEQEQERMDFVRQVIIQHKASDLYRTAEIADEYDRQQNRTIMEYRNLLYTMTGEAVPDNFSANHKTASGFFNRFVTQQNQFLLGNGVTWQEKSTEERLGKDFDIRVQEAGKSALVGGVSFGFFNFDHLEVFSVLEFAPLYDEENGALCAGVRFWQVSSDKPLRATLYEIDGYTDYMWQDGKGRIIQDKRSYTEIVTRSEVDGVTIYDGENYPTFPIVPLWGNPHKSSEILGIRSEIDAYDLIKSGFANDLDDASQIYWTIQNAGGMDDVDLKKFLDRMKTVKAAVVEDEGARAESHTIDVPYNAREALLDRLRKDLYDDYMALDTKEIASGAVTATQIRAAYEPLDNKVDQYEYCVKEFLQGILDVLGIEDNPTFTRSYLVNTQEEIGIILQAAQYLDDEYVTRRILTLLGDADKADEVIQAMEDYDYKRMTGNEPTEEEPTEEGNE